MVDISFNQWTPKERRIVHLYQWVVKKLLDKPSHTAYSDTQNKLSTKWLK